MRGRDMGDWWVVGVHACLHVHVIVQTLAHVHVSLRILKPAISTSLNIAQSLQIHHCSAPDCTSSISFPVSLFDLLR